MKMEPKTPQLIKKQQIKIYSEKKRSVTSAHIYKASSYLDDNSIKVSNDKKENMKGFISHHNSNTKKSKEVSSSMNIISLDDNKVKQH